MSIYIYPLVNEQKITAAEQNRTAAEQNMACYNKCINQIAYLVKLDNTIKGPTIFVPVVKGTTLYETLFLSDFYPLDFDSDKDYTFFGKEIEDRLRYAYGKNFKENSYKITWFPKIPNRPPILCVKPLTKEENHFEEDTIHLLIEEDSLCY